MNAKCMLVCALSLSSLMLAAVVQAAPPPPETLAMRDLINQPDRWPATVALKKDFTIQGGPTLRTGQQVRVLEVNGAEVVIDAGNNMALGIPAEDCDLVEAANKTWAALTPEQRAIDAATLMDDASLWPEKAACLTGFQLDSGRQIPPGEEFPVISIDQQGVQLWSPQDKARLLADVPQTDVIARARERALIEPAKRSSPIVAALRDNLVDASGKKVSGKALDDTQVFALYYGASWCGPCRAFSPGFVDWASKNAAAHPKMMIVLMSNDEKDSDMAQYMTEEKMPWPALPLSVLQQTPVLSRYSKGAIPQLVIVDRFGKILADSYQGEQYIGPKAALESLDKLLASGVAQ